MTIRLPETFRLPDPAHFGFDLENRELAALIYLAVIIGWVMMWGRSRQHLGPVLKAFFSPTLVKIWLVMTGYTIACVYLLHALQGWEWENLKTTLLWWVTFGFASMWEAQKISDERSAFGRLLRDAVNITAVIVFLAEVKSFPLWGEMILLPVLTFVGMLIAVAQAKKEHSIIVRPLTNLTAVIGIAILANGIGGIIEDPKDFFEWNTVREFFVPIILSVMFIPLMILMAAWMTIEGAFVSLRVQAGDDRLIRYASTKSLLAFAFDPDGAKRLARNLRLNGIKDRAGVDASIRAIKTRKAIEKRPPVVPMVEGWSPFEAVDFLEAYGIRANDWHAAFDEWRADAPSIQLGEGFLRDDVSYYLSGNERAATKISLVLFANAGSDPSQSDESFYSMVLTILRRTYEAGLALEALERLIGNGDVEFELGGHTLTMAHHTWGDGGRGGYSRRFSIRHSAHVLNRFDDEFYALAETTDQAPD